MTAKKLSLFYIPVLFLLFLYSFTQVDLSLTISKIPAVLSFQHFFQQIGYFQRPLSTAYYAGILILLFSFYFLFLDLAHKNKITKKQVWFLVFAISAILTLSYNAFSYDFFNYIFDAKIVTHYNLNPYEHKALDFPGDPMLTFMHWTHRVYPYGPSWLGLTVPLSFFGSGIFTFTFFLFKLLAALSFIGVAYFISKILKKISPKNEFFGIIFFALNPLIIIESLVSAHLDIVMTFFAVLALYFAVNKNVAFSFLSLIFSIGIKFATLFLIPVFGWIWFRKQINWDKVFLASTILMFASVAAAALRTNFQPWYLIPVIPFAALIAKKYYIIIPTVIISFFSLLQYVPYLYIGNWDEPIPTILVSLTIIGLLVSLFLVILKKYKVL